MSVSSQYATERHINSQSSPELQLPECNMLTVRVVLGSHLKYIIYIFEPTEGEPRNVSQESLGIVVSEESTAVTCLPGNAIDGK